MQTNTSPVEGDCKLEETRRKGRNYLLHAYKVTPVIWKNMKSHKVARNTSGFGSVIALIISSMAMSRQYVINTIR